jgi:hypothetical protein
MPAAGVTHILQEFDQEERLLQVTPIIYAKSKKMGGLCTPERCCSSHTGHGRRLGSRPLPCCHTWNKLRKLFCSPLTNEKFLLPIFNEYGQKLVGTWKTTIGTYDEVVDLYSFESLAAMEKIRQETMDGIKKWNG